MALGEFEQILLLGLLQLGGKAHGVPLRGEIYRRTGRRVSAGAVFTAMERLEKRGLIDSALGEPTSKRGGKRRRIYEIAPAGLAAIHRSLKTLDSMTDGLSAFPETP